MCVNMIVLVNRSRLSPAGISSNCKRKESKVRDEVQQVKKIYETKSKDSERKKALAKLLIEICGWTWERSSKEIHRGGRAVENGKSPAKKADFIPENTKGRTIV